MNEEHKQFIFETYKFFPDERRLDLHYSIDNKYNFVESYKFDFEFVAYEQEVLDRALQNLFFMAGVSYYKLFLPSEIVIQSGELDINSASFYSKTWQKGLGEFFYVNNLDPNTEIALPSNIDQRSPLPANGSGLLVGIGGGKDSLVSVELLRDDPNLATWSVDHKEQLAPLVERIGLPHYWVQRTYDKQLLELNSLPGTYNGHIPISAIYATVGTVVSILTGNKDVVVSNEASADEPTLKYQGVAINHQYSKSSEFERDYQAQLSRDFGDGLRYYSFLRPLSELRISEVFAQIGLGKYSGVFSSCNRAFTHDQTSIFWCGQCPKCAFVYLAISPFVSKQQLLELFGGKNLLLDPSLENTYRQLLGISGDKPLECVGEVKESRAAMRLAQEHTPELNKYVFDLPSDYDFRDLRPDNMPEELRQILENKLQNL